MTPYVVLWEVTCVTEESSYETLGLVSGLFVTYWRCVSSKEYVTFEFMATANQSLQLGVWIRRALASVWKSVLCAEI
jgi:hypothetical protein